MSVNTQKNRNSTPNGISAVVSDDVKKRPLFFKINLSVSVILVVVAVVVALAVYILQASHVQQKKDSQINFDRIKSVKLSNDCSAKAQQSVAKEQPNKQQVDASIVLLTYKAYCLESEAKYQDANQVLVQLKGYYAMRNLPQYIKQVDAEINFNNKALQK